MRYIIHMSNKKEYQIDEEDFNKLKGNMADASMIFLKQVAINPSFLISVEPIPFVSTPMVEMKTLSDGRQIAVKTAKYFHERALKDLWKDEPKQL